MILYVLIPLVLALTVLISGLLLYGRMRNTAPAFDSGRFWPVESQLLKVLESLLDKQMADKLSKQIQYFESAGKYWRIDEEFACGAELLEEEILPMQSDAFFDLEEEFDLARISFQVKDEPYEVVYRLACGRLWGWTISPALPEKKRFSSVKVLEAELLGHPEISQLQRTAAAASTVKQAATLASSVAGRRS